MNKLINNKIFILACGLFVVLLWSGNFIFIKFVLEEFNVYTALFYRLLLVSIVLIPFVSRPNKHDLLILLLITIVLVPGHYGLLFLALNKTSSVGAVSVIIQLSIPFSVILSWFVFKDHMNKMRLFGLIIAFTGIVILFYEPSMFDNLEALAIALVSAFCLGLYFILVKKIKTLSAFGIIAYTSLGGLPFLYLLMLYNDEDIYSFFIVTSQIAWSGFFYTVIAGSILGHGIWAWLVKYQDISFISPFLLLVPVLAVFLSAIVFNEIITFYFVLVSFIIIFGIFLVFMSMKTKKIH